MVTCAGLLIASRGQQGVCLGATGRSSVTPAGVRRFVIRATHERGVGVPSSRSLSTASHEASSVYARGGPAGDVRCAWAVSAQQCCTLCVVDDLEPLTDAERKLLEAVQTGGLCDLSQDDETD